MPQDYILLMGGEYADDWARYDTAITDLSEPSCVPRSEGGRAGKGVLGAGGVGRARG